MKLKLIGFFGVVTSLMVTAIQADEPYLQLIQAMRDRYYPDYALLYIEELKQRNDVPADVKQVLDYEAYRVHQASARLARTAEDKQAELEKALAALERFVEVAPNHPLAAEANAQRAEIFLDRAKALIWERRSENDVRKKAEQQKEAQNWIAKAREVFAKAESQYAKAYDAYKGVFLDEDKDEEEYNKRAKIEQEYIRAQISLANCTYEEARTYDVGSEKFNALIQQASEEYETIHTKYRSQGAGLYARVLMGKCFEEMGELGRALGIYNEILEHPGTSETMVNLKAQTFYFKLIVLNKPEKKDHKLVVSEATIWLKDNSKLSRTTQGIGIQWERARALEILGGSPDATQEEKDEYLQRAYNEAQEISLFAGEFRDLATAMAQRLEPLVEGKGTVPKDFGVAFSIARNKTRQHTEFSNKIKEAQSPELKKAAQAEFDLHLKDTESMIRLGLSLVDEDSKSEDVAAMRYFLAITMYFSKKPYDAAAVANYVVRTATEDQAKAAQDAAYLGLAALQQIYVAAPENNRDEERQMMADAAELLASRWPNSSRADDAYLILGDVYRNANEHLKAGETFGKVNQSNERYAEALLKGGQAYWVAYLRALREDEADRPQQEELDKWLKLAEDNIVKGLGLIEKDLSKEGTPPDIYTAVKITLAEIKNTQGKEKEALSLLLEGDHSVIKHISVEDETQRPERGPKSRPVAIQAYQLVLRAYMGVEEIDKAIATMSDLERVAGSDDPEALTQIYIELGVKLSDEIERLRAQQNQDRLTTVTSAFDRFLGALSGRQEGLNYNTLLWIAESYSSLGMGMKGDSSAAANYFENAARAYDRILSEAKNNPNFIEERFIPGIQTRIGVLKRRQGDFEGALTQLETVLEADKRRLEAQFEAATTLKEWAEVANEPEKYLDAAMGNKRLKESPIYGFSQLALLYQRIWDDPRSQLKDADRRFFDTLYEVADCQYQYASKQSDSETAKKFFDAAKATITAFSLYGAEDADKDTWSKYADLYEQIQRAQGVAEIVTLERPETQAPNNVAGGNDTQNTGSKPKSAEDQKKVVQFDPGEREDPNYLMAIIGIAVALGLAGGMVFLMKPKKGKRKPRPGVSEEPAKIELPNPEGTPSQPARKKKSVAEMTPEEKKAVQRKLMAQKKAKQQALKQKAAAQAKEKPTEGS